MAPSPSRTLHAWGCGLLLAASLALVATAAHATLGGLSSSIASDHAALKALSLRVQTDPSGKFTVHEATLPSGTLIRQYTDASGFVFAIGWSGPYQPDLRQLLGTHFDAMLAAARKQPPHAGHSQMALSSGDLVVRSGGHMRSFNGLAYLVSKLPAGLTESDLK